MQCLTLSTQNDKIVLENNKYYMVVTKHNSFVIYKYKKYNETLNLNEFVGCYYNAFDAFSEFYKLSKKEEYD